MNWNLQTLRQSATDRVLCGVCGGLGENTPVPTWIWRLAFVLTFFGTAGCSLLVYIAVALFMPDANGSTDKLTQ